MEDGDWMTRVYDWFFIAKNPRLYTLKPQIRRILEIVSQHPFSPGHIGIGVGKILESKEDIRSTDPIGIDPRPFPRRVEFKTSENPYPDTHSMGRTVYLPTVFFS